MKHLIRMINLAIGTTGDDVLVVVSKRSVPFNRVKVALANADADRTPITKPTNWDAPLLAVSDSLPEALAALDALCQRTFQEMDGA